MPGRPVFLSHRSSLEHDTGGHPEQPARITAIERELERHDWFGFSRVESVAVEIDTLTAVHPASHVEMVRALSARGGGMLDADTIASTGSFEAALHGAGGAVGMVDRIVAGDAPCGFSAHRPPGHHALPTRAMGFCLFNSVAVAARHALDSLGLERVMILDWDVHHGNGTNDIFRPSREVLFLSIHQSPLYPGTGAASDVGTDEGEGFTINLPVPPGAGDFEFVSLVEGVAVPLVRAFEPQLLLVSAGYDAHANDPLANCRVSERGYAAMTASLLATGVPVGVVLEGGYALDALASSVAATMSVLAGNGGGGSASASAADLADPELAAPARQYFSRWWPELA